jgi:hypothetical protein
MKAVKFVLPVILYNLVTWLFYLEGRAEIEVVNRMTRDVTGKLGRLHDEALHNFRCVRVFVSIARAAAHRGYQKRMRLRRMIN